MVTKQKKSTQKPKTTTEFPDIREFFGDFKTEYTPFVSWYSDPVRSDLKTCIVSFKENKPIKYKNKWDREQWKILVEDDYDTTALLSGGKRLFQTIMGFCQKEHKLPMDLDAILISRIGSGFDTKYKIEYH